MLRRAVAPPALAALALALALCSVASSCAQAAPCEFNSDCAAGFYCAAGACKRDCFDGLDCDPGFVCGVVGKCVPADGGAPGDGAVGEGGALVSFLTHASLEAGEHQAREGQDAVQLMSVHAAKGLEFDVVFLTGLEQGLFPHENAIAEGRDGLEEERRLMYVAVTRARQRLYLSCAQTRLLHGQTRYCVPSGFLEEIPAELLLKLNRTQAATPVPLAPAYGAAAPALAGGWRIEATENIHQGTFSGTGRAHEGNVFIFENFGSYRTQGMNQFSSYNILT